MTHHTITEALATALEDAIRHLREAPYKGLIADLLEQKLTAYRVQEAAPAAAEGRSHTWVTEFCSRYSGEDLVKAGDVLDFLMHLPIELFAAHPQPAQGEGVAWANFRHSPPSYVPYRTRAEAEASVKRSQISATQEGPFSVVALVPQAATHPVAGMAGQGLTLTDEQIAEIALKSVYDGDTSIPHREGWVRDVGIPFARALGIHPASDKPASEGASNAASIRTTGEAER